MTGKALICKLGELQPIEGADRIAQVTMFGETVIVSKDHKQGEIGLLFDCETQLSHEYCSANNLYRHNHLNSDKSVTGYMEDNRRVRPIRLKGVRCSAMWMPLESISKMIGDDILITNLNVGMEVDHIGEFPICNKYVVEPKNGKSSLGPKGQAVKENLVPTFKEHMDTDQWGRNMHKVQEGDLVIITEKLHGTSGRCGYLPAKLPDDSLWFRIVDFITGLLYGFGIKDSWEMAKSPEYDYAFVVGSRRTVKSVETMPLADRQHYYGEDLWTTIASEHFEGKLRKGETVYFEIVGYTPSGESIMPSVPNAKLKKFMNGTEYQEFLHKYGDVTHFTYGCKEDYDNLQGFGYAQNKVFVYRITMTNEDGESIDLSWEQVKQRCEQLGVNHVPELKKLLMWDSTHPFTSDGLSLEKIVDAYTNTDSKEFPQHVREGVCIRIENGSLSPLILKNKSFIFKVLENIITDTVATVEDTN